MTRVALLSRSANLAYFQPLLNGQDPDLDIAVWPDPACLQADVAVCWNPPAGVYADMPNLRMIHSIAAGVDNLLAEQNTRGLPVCRVVDPQLAQGMLQYVLWSVLYFHRKLDAAFANQAQARWHRTAQVPAADCRIGIMGLGELGGSIASWLPKMGYEVHGWSRNPRAIEGVTVHAGDEGFKTFLSSSDVLICLLPLTSATRGILCASTFSALPAGAAVINCGRGEHLVPDDLIAALQSGHLRGAVLDVFAREPLAADDPLWRTPGVVVTPHMATMPAPTTVAEQVVANIHRMRQGAPLANTVDTTRGY